MQSMDKHVIHEVVLIQLVDTHTSLVMIETLSNTERMSFQQLLKMKRTEQKNLLKMVVMMMEDSNKVLI